MSGLRLLSRLLPVALLALSLAGIGFAHRHAPVSPEMQAFLSIGGTLDEICGGDHAPHGASEDCDACRISNELRADGAIRVAMDAPEGSCGSRIGHHSLLHTKETDKTRPPARAPPSLV